MSKSVQETEVETLRASRALARHLECLQHERRPRRPRQMTPGQVRIHQMAALFRAATPGAAQPDPAFVTQLEAQLEREWQSRLSEGLA